MKKLRIKQIFTILFSFFFTHTLLAGQIYKWVDDNGQTHFGTQPPAEQKKQVVGKSNQTPILHSHDTKKSTAPVEQLLVGHWKGTRLGKEVDIVFSKKGNFIESIAHKRKGYTTIHRRSYGGHWTRYKRRLTFKVTFEDQGAEFIPAMSDATIVGHENGKFMLVWDDDTEILTKQYRKSMPAFPKELR